jgi:hypothetical protein
MPTESEPKAIESLASTIRDLLAWCNAERAPVVIIGGVAASLLGRPRVTADVDALLFLHESQWTGFVQVADRFGFRPRVDDPLEFARRARVLLFIHERSGVCVDLALAGLPFEDELLARATVKHIAGISVPVPSPEDLAILKAVAGRPRDLTDLEGLLAANPGMDLDRVVSWVTEFARSLEMPDLLENLKRLIDEHRRAQGR